MYYVNRTLIFKDYAYRQFMSRDKDEFKNDLCNRILADVLKRSNRFAWSYITHVDRDDDFSGHEDFSLGRYSNVGGITNDIMFMPTFNKHHIGLINQIQSQKANKNERHCQSVSQ